MIATIDGDIVAYRCAASANNDPLEIALLRTEQLMQSILDETNSDSYHCFLTGQENFRKIVYPDYKANRKDMPVPVHLAACKEYLESTWNAKKEKHLEADDLLSMYQSDDTILCSIDKDLLQVPGKHYNFVKKEFLEVGELSGKIQYWTQMLVGDKSDNVLGYDGVSRNTIPKFINKIVDENLDTLDETVLSLYNDKYSFLINSIVLTMMTGECKICLPKIVNQLLISSPEMATKFDSMQQTLAQIGVFMELTGTEKHGI